MDVKKLTVT